MRKKKLGKAQKEQLVIRSAQRAAYEEKKAKIDEEERKRLERQQFFNKGDAQKNLTTHLTQFDGLSRYEIEKSKRDAQKLVICEYKAIEIKLPFLLNLNPLSPKKMLPIPIRPKWKQGMAKDEIDQQEVEYFQTYLQTMKKHGDDNLSYFEHNFLVWRQLWNCMEISDVVVLFADIRFPSFHFPYRVYLHLKEVNKPCLLVLTKCDLVSEDSIKAWVQYFEKNYEGLTVVPVASFMKEEITNTTKLKQTQKKYAPQGLQELIAKVQELVPHKKVFLDTPSEAQATEPQETTSEDVKKVEVPESQETTTPSEQSEKKPRERKYLTLGMIGQPNVGKSSLINALKGTKVVSVSSTPGHTKWRQDIYINESLMLCDCPGLVFPMLDLPRPLQVLIGLVPLASLQDPWTILTFVMKYLPLYKMIKITKPQSLDSEVLIDESLDKEIEEDLSPWDLATAYSASRGYMTHKNVPDAHRGSKEIVTDLVEGRYMLYTLPVTQQKSTRPKVAPKVQKSGIIVPSSQNKKSKDEEKQEWPSEESKESSSESEESFERPPQKNPFALLNDNQSSEEEDD